MNEPAWQSEREWLRDLLSRLEQASHDDDIFAIHVSLLARLKARQKLTAELRGQVEALGDRRRELAVANPKPVAELRIVQAEFEQERWAEWVQRRLHWLLLDVGDALVWQRLAFDRAAITALGQGRRVGWLSDGRGWDAEVSAVDKLWGEGVLAIINDATTCLRLGDLTCFFEDRIEIREVKAGRLVADEHPQQVRLRDAITLINERRGVFEGVRRAIVRCPEPLDTYLRHLPRAIARARRNGRSILKLSRAQLLVVHDLHHGTPDPFGYAEAIAAARWPRSDVVLDWGTTLRRMRDRHYNFAFLAPLALLPLEIDDKVDLLLGQLDYTVWVNVSSVGSTLRGRGLIAEAIVPPESETWFLRVARPRGNTATQVHVAAHIREMMAIELVTPLYVVKMVETLLDSVVRDPELFNEQTAVVPGEERAAWKPRAA